MSVVDRRNVKMVLPRDGADSFWSRVRKEFLNVGTKEQQQRRWKYLAMLALRENAGWQLDAIGAVFGHPKGHVVRCLPRIKQELREHFGDSPEFLCLGDDDPDSPDNAPS